MKSAKNNEKEILLYLYTSIFKNRGGQKEPQYSPSLPPSWNYCTPNSWVSCLSSFIPFQLLHRLPPYYFPLPSSLFPKSNSKGQLEKEGKIQLPSVDKRECSLFGIHQATSPLPEGEKKGKIHPPLVDNQEWNLLGIYQATPSSLLNLSLLLTKPII